MGEHGQFEHNPAIDARLAAAVEEVFEGLEQDGPDIAVAVAGAFSLDDHIGDLQEPTPDDPISQDVAADNARAQLEALYAEPSIVRSDEDAVLELEREVYAHSMRLMRKIGEAAMTGVADAEIARMIESLKSDFESSIVEMLQTDAEFRKLLEITREREHTVRNRKVVVLRGQTEEPIVDMLERGLAFSQKAAEADARMQVQVNRDAADLRNANEVDDMPVRTLRMTLAIDPKKAMAADPNFWREMGYREGLAFLQCYYKVDEYTLVSFAYSVDHSDLAKWRATWAAHGGDIPADASDETWLDYAIVEPCASVDEARARVAGLRHAYYHTHNIPAPLRSVDEFKTANQQIIDDVFYKVYLPLTTAQYSVDMNDTLRSLAHSLRDQSAHLNTEAKAQLECLCTARTIDDEGVRFLEDIIRYGLVEHLRDQLGMFARHEQVGGVAMPLVLRQSPLFSLQLVGNIAAGVARGTAAGRTYGGCTKVRNNGAGDSEDDQGTDGVRNRQNVYGGLAGDGSAESEGGVCVVETSNCYCCAYNNDGTSRGSKLTVRAKIDARETIHCLRPGCGAWMSKGGKNKFKGYIAARAEMLASAATPTVEDDADEQDETAAAHISLQGSDAIPEIEAADLDMPADVSSDNIDPSTRIAGQVPRARNEMGLAV